MPNSQREVIVVINGRILRNRGRLQRLVVGCGRSLGNRVFPVGDKEASGRLHGHY